MDTFEWRKDVVMVMNLVGGRIALCCRQMALTDQMTEKLFLTLSRIERRKEKHIRVILDVKENSTDLLIFSLKVYFI